MRVSRREAQLIEALLRHPEGLTADGLAERLGVSARTVHRDLRPASEFLESHGLALVRRAGLGLKVQGAERAWEQALEALGESQSSSYTPEERRRSLLVMLLGSDEPIKLRALASRLKVAVGTVGRDLDEVQEWLEDFGLSLLRRPGYGLEILGPESGVRRAMSQLILGNLDESSLLPRLTDSPGQESVSERLMGMMDEDRLRRVEALTGAEVESLPYEIADSAFVGLSVHVALMVERILRGGEIEVDHDALQRLRQTNEYSHARSLAAAIEEEFGVDVPEQEISYITTHLRGAKLRQDEQGAYSGDLEVAAKVKALIHYVEAQTGMTLAGDGSLYSGLLAHLERAIYRLRENMGIHNPLLEEIREDYPALFEMIEHGMRETFVEEIPDEEVGFVAMHFGAALDRGRGSYPRRVLAICPAGIGSAKMLASRLERAFPQIQSIHNASLFELENLDITGFDLIVSTVSLSLPEEDYVQVQPLLSQDEAERIRTHLKEKSVGVGLTNRAVSESLEVFGGGQERFHQMAEATQTIAELIDDAFLERHEAKGSVPEAVRRMCASLASRGLVSDAGRLEDGLLSRMELGGVGIPGTSLALFHARNDAVARPAFSVHDFEEPLQIESMDGAQIRISRSLLMVAPQELSPVALEAISEISVTIVERPAEREALEAGSQAQITAVLQNIFGRYLQNKLS